MEKTFIEDSAGPSPQFLTSGLYSGGSNLTKFSKLSGGDVVHVLTKMSIIGEEQGKTAEAGSNDQERKL